MSTTHIPPTLPAGAPLAGGFFAGRFFAGSQAFGLVLAPKDEGELEATKWGGLKNVAAAISATDGFANTEAMAAAGSKLGQWARALRLGGHDDWYIPSRLELLLAFAEMRDQFAQDWYWTSTQTKQDTQYAWIQLFGNGGQYDDRKDFELRARAVRRVPL